MDLSEHNLLGQRGETAAARFLESKGYKLVTRNFRANGGEIDIVALDGDTTVFAEVKTRSGGPSVRFGRAGNAIDQRKLKNLKTAIAEYQRIYPESQKCRMEAVEVYYVNGMFEIKLLPILRYG